MSDYVTSISHPVLPSERIGLAEALRSIGHPIRIEILRTLAKSGEACCGDLVDALPLAQSTVSQHIGVLKAAGLVRCEVRGRCCHYSLDREMLGTFSLAVAELFSSLGEEPHCPMSLAPVEQALSLEGNIRRNAADANLSPREDLP